MEPVGAENYYRQLVDSALNPLMDILLTTTFTPTLYGWLCIAVVACALVMPKGLLAMDRLLARRPAHSEWSGWPDGLQEPHTIQLPIWPRVITAIGGALLFAALLTLMFLCRQLVL